VNLGQIKAEVAAHFDPQANTSGRVTTWINLAYGKIGSYGRWSWAERVANLDVVAGQQNYTLVNNATLPGFAGVISVSWVGWNAHDLEEVDQRLFDDITIGSSAFTTTVGSTASGAATVNVTNTQGYPAAGYALVGGFLVAYTGTTATTLTGVSGVGGTVAAGSAVRSILVSVSPSIYTLGGDVVEATSAAAAASGSQRISIYPAPITSTPGALQVRYSRAGLDLSADSDTPIIPARHHSVLIDLAVARGKRAEGDFLGANMYQQSAAEELGVMLQEDPAMRQGDPDGLTEKKAQNLAAAASGGRG
jgi:hypothetical protein